MSEASVKLINILHAKWPVENLPTPYQSGRADGITHAIAIIKNFFASEADLDPWVSVEEGYPKEADCLHSWYVCEIVINGSLRYITMTWHDLASSLKFRSTTNGMTRYKEITPPRSVA